MEQIKRNYVLEQSDEQLIEDAIRGMVSSLDNQSRYLNHEELAAFENAATSPVTGTRAFQISTLPSGYTYLDIDFFYLSISEAVQKELEKKNNKGLIIDLRDNGGGFLEAAVALTDLFVDEGLIVHSRGRTAEANRYYNSTETTPFRQLPVVILVNEITASASEIMAAAMQDHKRAIIIGTNTYGKGSVQSLIYTDIGAIQITTSMNYRPSGEVIHTSGVRPDIEVLPNQGAEASIGASEQPANALVEEAIRTFF